MGMRSILSGTILILVAINLACCEDDDSIVNSLQEENLLMVEERLYRNRRETPIEGSGDVDSTTSPGDDLDDSTITYLTTNSDIGNSDLANTSSTATTATPSTATTATTSSIATTATSSIATTATPSTATTATKPSTATTSSIATADNTSSTADTPSTATTATTSSTATTATKSSIATTAPPVVILGHADANNESFISNDDIVSMICYFMVRPDKDDVKVTWYKLERPLTSAGRMVIYTNNTGGNYQTELNISPALRRDTGNYSCSASAAGVNTTLAIEVIVYEKPRVMLSPSVVSLQGDMTQKLACDVSNPESIEAPPERLVWCFGGDSITDDERITVVSPGHEVLTLNTTQPEGTYGCGVDECTETAEFVIYTQEDETCDKQEDEKGTDWPQTLGGLSLVLPCPSGYLGTVTRYCTQDGEWEKPDYINCLNENIAKANATLTSIEEGTASAEEVKVVLTGLSSVNLSTSTASAGDLDVSIDIVSDIVRVFKSINFNIDNSTAQYFLDVVDNIMSADTSEDGQWEQVKQQEPRKAEGLMNSVTSFGLTAARSQKKNTSMQITRTNLVVEIGNNVLGDINFPKNADFKDDFLFPGSNFQEHDEDIMFMAVSYKTMEDFLPKNTSMADGSEKFVKSDIISLAIEIDGKAVDRLYDDIILNFQHTQENFTEPACGYWDFQDNQWKTDGCTAKELNATYTSCSCSHLTNFAILMSPSRDISEETALHLKIITIVGCSLSILGCVLTFIVHVALWRYVRSGKTTILMHLCVCLTLAYTVFLAGVDRTENKAVCTAVAALLHYFFLGAFFLMLAEGIEIALQIICVFKSCLKLRCLLPMAWVLPAIIVGVTLGITRLEGYGNENFCWLTLDGGVLYAFVGPALAVILVNFIVVIAAIKAYWSSSLLNKKEKKEKTLAGLRGLCVLMPVLGVTWVLGVLSVNEDSVIFQYLFAIFNTLQGFLIFLMHTLMNRSVHDGIRRRKYKYDSQKAVQSMSFYKGKDIDADYHAEPIRMKEVAYKASNDSLYGTNSGTTETPNSGSREMPETWQDQVIDDESYPLPRISIPDSESVPPVSRVSISIQDSKPSQDVDSKVYRRSYTEESPRHHSVSVQEVTTSFHTNDDDVTHFNNRIQRPSVQRQPRSSDIYSRSNDEVQPLRIKKSSYSNDVYLAERRMPYRFAEECDVNPERDVAQQRDVTPQRGYSNGVYGNGDDDVTVSSSDRLYRPTSMKRSSDYTIYRGDDPRMPSCYSQREEQPPAKRRQRNAESAYVSDDHLQYKKPMFNTHL